MNRVDRLPPHSAEAEQGVLGGLDLAPYYPELGNAVLVCTTWLTAWPPCWATSLAAWANWAASREVSALTAYHWVYRETLKPWLIADLLILNNSLPRSLSSCYDNLVRNLDQLGVAYGRQGPAQRHARGIRNRLQHSSMDNIFQHGLHEFIQEFIADNNRLGDIIAKQ